MMQYATVETLKLLEKQFIRNDVTINNPCTIIDGKHENKKRRIISLYTPPDRVGKLKL